MKRLQRELSMFGDFTALLLGGGIGQLITFIMLPMQSRLFTADAIGRYGVVIAATNIGVVLCTLKIETLIASIASSDARNTLVRAALWTSMWCSLFTSMVALIAGLTHLAPVGLVICIVVSSFVTAALTLLSQLSVLRGQLMQIAGRNLLTGIVTGA